MIRITSSRHVRIWWSLNPPSEPIDLHFCAIAAPIRKIAPLLLVTSSLTHAITGAPLQMRSGPVAMRSRNLTATSWSRPLRPSSRTTRSGNTTKKTGRTHHINWADVGESEPQSDITADRGLDLANGAIPARDSGPTSSPGKQASVPCANLGTRVLSSSRQ